jgi:hypothetical protein
MASELLDAGIARRALLRRRIIGESRLASMAGISGYGFDSKTSRKFKVNQFHFGAEG